MAVSKQQEQKGQANSWKWVRQKNKKQWTVKTKALESMIMKFLRNNVIWFLGVAPALI